MTPADETTPVAPAPDKDDELAPTRTMSTKTRLQPSQLLTVVIYQPPSTEDEVMARMQAATRRTRFSHPGLELIPLRGTNEHSLPTRWAVMFTAKGAAVRHLIDILALRDSEAVVYLDSESARDGITQHEQERVLSHTRRSERAKELGTAW